MKNLYIPFIFSFSLFLISGLAIGQNAKSKNNYPIEKSDENIVQDKGKISPEMDKLKTDEEINSPAPSPYIIKVVNPSENSVNERGKENNAETSEAIIPPKINR